MAIRFRVIDILPGQHADVPDYAELVTYRRPTPYYSGGFSPSYSLLVRYDAGDEIVKEQ